MVSLPHSMGDTFCGRGGTQVWAQTRKGKKTPGKDFNKSADMSFASKCDKIMRKSVGKCPIQKCVNVCLDKMRRKMRKYVGKCPIQK